MILRAVLLVSCVAAPAAFAAGLWRGENAPPEPAVVAARVNAPLVGKPGSGVSDAGRYFAALNAPPSAPPPPPLPPPPAPPPPPDVAVLFRRDLSAVLSSPGAEPRVVLSGSRTLRPGDMYRDGWMLTNVTGSTATLTKGGEQRNIGLFSPPPVAQPTMVAATPVTPPNIVFGNATPAGRPSAAQVAGIVSALRAAGMNPQQTERISQMLSSGAFDQVAASQMLNQMSRSNPMTPAQMNAIIQALQRAGVLQERQARNLAQSLPQMQNMQQLQQVMQMDGRGGNRGGNRGGGGRGPNAGFAGGNSAPLPAGRVGAFPAPPRPTPVPAPPPAPIPPVSAAPSGSGVSTVSLRNLGEGRALAVQDGVRLADVEIAAQ